MTKGHGQTGMNTATNGEPNYSHPSAPPAQPMQNPNQVPMQTNGQYYNPPQTHQQPTTTDGMYTGDVASAPPQYSNVPPATAPTFPQQQDHNPHQIPLQIHNHDTAGNVDDTPNVDDVQEAAPMEEDVGCCEGCAASMHCKSWWLTIFTLGFLVPACLFQNPLLLIGTGIFYIFYLIESCCSSSFKYLDNFHDQETVAELFANVRKNPPTIGWYVECYHYETRHYTESYTDSDGKTRYRTRTERVKVTTHTASTNFTYDQWIDVSKQWDAITDYKLTKITCHKHYVFADAATERIYHAEKNAFKVMHNRDVYQDFSESVDIAGFRKKVLAEMQPGVTPCCLSSGWFGFWTMILGSVCYRYWFGSITGRKDYTFMKQISRSARPVAVVPVVPVVGII